MADVLSKVSPLKVEAILFLRVHSSHLIFFLSSGTSYTIELIQSISDKPTATNYGAETLDKEKVEQMLPVVDDQPQGPYWLGQPFQRQLGEFLLTKVGASSCISFQIFLPDLKPL
jgi:hypothetical protein